MATAHKGRTSGAPLRLVTRLSVRPADLCDRARELAVAHTRELEPSGVTAETDTPVMVGSHYHLEFGDPGLPELLALCDRCAMVDRDTAEVHFRFLEELELPGGFPDEE